MSWLGLLMNTIALMLGGLAIIYIVNKIWGWWFSTHDANRE
jgi:hypothetical protein